MVGAARIRRRLGLGAAALGLIAVGSAQAAKPTIYVNYTIGCTFTITDDSGKAVTAIPAGDYQILVRTPGSFGGVDLSGIFDMTACKGAVDFRLTGPGVSLATTLDDGDADSDFLYTTFMPSSTYTAVDGHQPTVAHATFATTSATLARLEWSDDDVLRRPPRRPATVVSPALVLCAARRIGLRGGQARAEAPRPGRLDAPPWALRRHRDRWEQHGRLHRPARWEGRDDADDARLHGPEAHLGHPDQGHLVLLREARREEDVLRRQLSSATAAAWIAALVARNDFPGAVAAPSKVEQRPPASSTISCTAA